MIQFLVRVPEATSPDRPLFLAGDGPALGDWSACGVPLERDDDGTYRAAVDLPAGFRGYFLVTGGRWRQVEADGHSPEPVPRELHVGGPATVEVHVHAWGRHSVQYHPDFASNFLPHPRTLAVWLPPGYHRDPARRFPVLYMGDGQNLFDPETAFAGNAWFADDVAEREVRAGRVEPLILVGVANSPDRLQEYGPRQAGDMAHDYGRFLVEEVKPFIDAEYRTLTGPEHTGVGGSSMGGLIALHLCQWYPDVFGRCAAMSPALWWEHGYFLRNLMAAPEWLDRCRVWLDMGTREGDTEAGMRAMVRRVRRLARLFERHGMREGEHFHVEVIEGGLHNEAAWSGRFDRVLRFLFGTDRLRAGAPG
jgi:predicted alpha/beta superfamily hydrolase